MIVPVVLAGGSGTRLWPVSRRKQPKQFTKLIDDSTMFELTLRRVASIPDVAEPVVIAGADQADLLRGSTPSGATILLEPSGRNTAPAAAIAALIANPDDVLLVLPADHLIADVDAFVLAVEEAARLASRGYVVTFGVVPTRPETGYGYIEQGPSLDGAFHIARFVEKPDEPTAREYLSSGRYLWNSGMFAFTARRYLDELGRHRPDMLEAVRTIPVHEDGRIDPSFAEVPADSIDFAVMEHTDRGVVVPLEAGWSDVGSWNALWEVSDQDTAGNVVQGDAVIENTRRSYVRSSSRLVAVVGLDDVVVVETPDAVLVTSRERSQEVKRIVERLARRPEIEEPAG